MYDSLVRNVVPLLLRVPAANNCMKGGVTNLLPGRLSEFDDAGGPWTISSSS